MPADLAAPPIVDGRRGIRRGGVLVGVGPCRWREAHRHRQASGDSCGTTAEHVRSFNPRLQETRFASLICDDGTSGLRSKLHAVRPTPPERLR